jgi:hypothetical protein
VHVRARACNCTLFFSLATRAGCSLLMVNTRSNQSHSSTNRILNRSLNRSRLLDHSPIASGSKMQRETSPPWVRGADTAFFRKGGW